MGWPLSQDYNEAVQAPANNFTDPDLRRGQAATNALGLPMPHSGNFADVYQLVGPGGARWAVKCFTREVPGLRQRYEAIGRQLRQADLPFTVDFTYLEKGILVAGQWYPVLKMEWVEGLTLNQFVARAADKPATLDSLLQMWARLGKYLRAAAVAHADLQHGNVLLVPGGNNALALKLVDYDGLWVPALAGGNSGEVGHPSYQHPRRGREGTYSREVDRFPLLLVATALRALMTGGRGLWEKYDNGDNLLFTEADLQAPTKSRLFLDLLRSADPLTVAMAGRTIDALRGGLESAPLLEEVLPEARRTKAVRATVIVEFTPVEDESPPVNDPPPRRPVILPRETARRGRVPTFVWTGGAVTLAVIVAAVVALVVFGGQGRRKQDTPDNSLVQRDDGPRDGTPATHEATSLAGWTDGGSTSRSLRGDTALEGEKGSDRHTGSPSEHGTGPADGEKEKKTEEEPKEIEKKDPDPVPERDEPKKRLDTAREKKPDTSPAKKESDAKRQLGLAMKLRDQMNDERFKIPRNRDREKELRENFEEALRKLLEKYPGTEAAAKAEKLLEEK